MLKRALFGTVLFIASTSVGWAAIPDPGASPAKPALNRASPMINDPLVGTRIRSKPPAASTSGKEAQAALPDDKQKPALHRASPMINDPLVGTKIHGAPTSATEGGH